MAALSLLAITSNEFQILLWALQRIGNLFTLCPYITDANGASCHIQYCISRSCSNLVSTKAEKICIMVFQCNSPSMFDGDLNCHTVQKRPHVTNEPASVVATRLCAKLL